MVNFQEIIGELEAQSIRDQSDFIEACFRNERERCEPKSEVFHHFLLLSESGRVSLHSDKGERLLFKNVNEARRFLDTLLFRIPNSKDFEAIKFQLDEIVRAERKWPMPSTNKNRFVSTQSLKL